MKNSILCTLGLALIAFPITARSQGAAPPEAPGAVLMDRARALAMQGRNEEASSAADAAVAAEPENFGLPVGRGEVLEQMGRRAEAAESYRTGLRVLQSWLTGATPEEAATYLRFHALILARLGRTPDSIDLVDAELRRAPENKRLLALRCEVRAEANFELQHALTDCNNVLAIEPRNETALFARGLTFLRMERWTDADSDFTALLRISPANPDALYGRALARQRMRDNRGAARDLAAARRHLFYIDSEFDRRGLRQASPPPVN